MIKLLIVAFLLYGTYWILRKKRASKSNILVWYIWIVVVTIAVTNEIYKYTIQINNIPVISYLFYKPDTEKIDNHERKSNQVTIRHLSEAKVYEDIDVIGNQQPQNKSTSNGIISNKHAVYTNEMIQNNADIIHGSRGFILDHNGKLNSSTAAAHHSDSAQNKKNSSPAEEIKATNLKPKINDDQISDLQNPTKDQSDPVTEKDKVRCPSVEKIQQVSQQINDAFLYDGTYRITTSEISFQESNLSWIAGVKDIVADSSDEAIEIAKITASKADHKKTEYAEPLWPGVNIYICEYGPGDVGAAGIDMESFKKTGRFG